MTKDEHTALMQLLVRTPMTSAEALWTRALMDREAQAFQPQPAPSADPMPEGWTSATATPDPAPNGRTA